MWLLRTSSGPLGMQSLGSVFVAVRVSWCLVPPAESPPAVTLVGQSRAASPDRALLLASLPYMFKNCLQQSGFLLGESCVFCSCLYQWLWSGFSAASHLCLGTELSLLLFHLHTFHLETHFWMVAEVHGRKRLRRSKIPLWSLRMLTNARWKRVQ